MTTLPVPMPTPETLPYWEGTRRGELVIQRCSACDSWVFHPRLRCPACSADRLEWTLASGRGSLWSYVIVHLAEAGFHDEVPYVLGVVELEEGPHMMSRIRGVDPTPEAVEIGTPLRVEFEPRGDQMLPVWWAGDER
jgi:uncharacterized protein